MPACMRRPRDNTKAILSMLASTCKIFMYLRFFFKKACAQKRLVDKKRVLVEIPPHLNG